MGVGARVERPPRGRGWTTLCLCDRHARGGAPKTHRGRVPPTPVAPLSAATPRPCRRPADAGLGLTPGHWGPPRPGGLRGCPSGGRRDPLRADTVTVASTLWATGPGGGVRASAKQPIEAESWTPLRRVTQTPGQWMFPLSPAQWARRSVSTAPSACSRGPMQTRARRSLAVARLSLADALRRASRRSSGELPAASPRGDATDGGDGRAGGNGPAFVGRARQRVVKSVRQHEPPQPPELLCRTLVAAAPPPRRRRHGRRGRAVTRSAVSSASTPRPASHGRRKRRADSHAVGVICAPCSHRPRALAVAVAVRAVPPAGGTYSV